MKPPSMPSGQATGPSDQGLLQAALECSAGGIIVLETMPDGSLQVMLVNRRAETYLGLDRADLIGKDVNQVFDVTLNGELWRTVQQVMATDQPKRQDQYLSVRRSNRAGWYDLCIAPGGHKRAVLTLNDISDRQEFSQQLRSEAILFKALSSTIPEMGVIVTDYFKKILMASGLLPDLLAQTQPDDLVGTLLENVVLPEFRQDWRNYLGTALNGEAHFFSDHWAGWRSEVYVGPVRNEAGAVVMILIVFRNVTEQYRQQQALIQSNMALEQSNRSLEQFAYVASHDLQEPLRKIRSFGDLLLSNYGEAIGPEGQSMVGRMQAASDRMSSLIKSLLAYARLSSEQRAPSVVHVEDLFNELISDLGVSIQERHGIIRLKPPLPILPGHEMQLRQLFQNLLTNALKFVPADRTPIITISARIVEGPHVPNVATGADSLFAEINIRDNGIGIDVDNYDKIFGLFNRLNNRKQYEGSGIGLATSKKVIENHRGAITIDSEVNVGSTFHVYLPMKGDSDPGVPVGEVH